MRIRKKTIIIFEAAVILILLLLILALYRSPAKITSEQNNSLLSNRITSNLLEPQSYLILNYDPLEEELTHFITENNLSVSVYVENLRDGAAMGIHEEEGYIPASMGKVPAAILIMKEVEQGKLQLDTELGILDEDRTSNDSMLYNESIKELPVSVLLEKMLKESDNIALNVLQRNIDPEEYDTLLGKYYGYYDQRISLEDSNRILVNPITIYNIYSSLYLSTILQQDNSQYILELLSNTSFPIHDIATIPENVTIAQKYGFRSGDGEPYFHDCGIMYFSEIRLFYCVMTKDLDQETGQKVIGTIVHRIYTYTLETRRELDYYKGS